MRNGALIDLYWKVIGWFMLVWCGFTVWFGAVFGIAYSTTEFAASVPDEQKGAIMLQKLPVLFGLGLTGLAARVRRSRR